MALSPEEIKHLDMIQAVIARMAGNSSSLKTWTVTLLAGIFALSAKDADRRFLLIALAPAIGFWALDSYYLAQERRYRALYDDVRYQRGVEAFSMATAAYVPSTTLVSALLSPTLIAFYGAISLFVAVLSVIVY